MRHTIGPMLDDERSKVAAAARLLAAEGLVRGTSGNVSARNGEHIAALTCLHDTFFPP